MYSMPEITVTRRKTLPISKTAKRLRRFLEENKPPEAIVDPSNYDDTHEAPSAELVCGIPDETLFQLEQICEALEAKRKRRATINDLPIAPLPSEQDEAKVMETPKKSKKRSRDDDDQASVPQTEVKKPAQDDKSELKKKKRRKSAVV